MRLCCLADIYYAFIWIFILTLWKTVAHNVKPYNNVRIYANTISIIHKIWYNNINTKILYKYQFYLGHFDQQSTCGVAVLAKFVNSLCICIVSLTLRISSDWDICLQRVQIILRCKWHYIQHDQSCIVGWYDNPGKSHHSYSKI